MSELLILLIALSVLIVGGILLFNWRQEKKFQRDMASKFTPIEQDVLINAPKAAKADPESFTISEPTIPNLANEQELTIEEAPTLQNQVFKPALAEIEIAKNTVETLPEITITNPINQAAESVSASIAEVPAAASKSTEKQATEKQDLETQALEKQPTEKQEDLDSTPNELNHQTDLIAILFLTKAKPAEAINESIAGLLLLHTHIRVYGLTDEAKWVAAKAENQLVFSKLAIGLQLADRGGPTAKVMINRFQHAVEMFGLENNAHVDWLNKGDASISAIELDSFCMEVDQTVGFHLQANQGQFHGTKLKGLLEAQNFKLTEDGKFYLHPETLPYLTDFYVTKIEAPMFSAEMLRQQTLSKITFKLEIPTVKNAVERFDEMVRLAKQLAHSLDASIVDEAGKLINDIHLEKIRQQLRMIQAKMIAKGIMPGESHALRLFF